MGSGSPPFACVEVVGGAEVVREGSAYLLALVIQRRYVVFLFDQIGSGGPCSWLFTCRACCKSFLSRNESPALQMQDDASSTTSYDSLRVPSPPPWMPPGLQLRLPKTVPAGDLGPPLLPLAPAEVGRDLSWGEAARGLGVSRLPSYRVDSSSSDSSDRANSDSDEGQLRSGADNASSSSAASICSLSSAGATPAAEGGVVPSLEAPEDPSEEVPNKSGLDSDCLASSIEVELQVRGEKNRTLIHWVLQDGRA